METIWLEYPPILINGLYFMCKGQYRIVIQPFVQSKIAMCATEYYNVVPLRLSFMSVFGFYTNVSILCVYLDFRFSFWTFFRQHVVHCVPYPHSSVARLYIRHVYHVQQ